MIDAWLQPLTLPTRPIPITMSFSQFPWSHQAQYPIIVRVFSSPPFLSLRHHRLGENANAMKLNHKGLSEPSIPIPLSVDWRLEVMEIVWALTIRRQRRRWRIDKRSKPQRQWRSRVLPSSLAALKAQTLLLPRYWSTAEPKAAKHSRWDRDDWKHGQGLSWRQLRALIG